MPPLCHVEVHGPPVKYGIEPGGSDTALVTRTHLVLESSGFQFLFSWNPCSNAFSEPSELFLHVQVPSSEDRGKGQEGPPRKAIPSGAASCLLPSSTGRGEDLRQVWESASVTIGGMKSTSHCHGKRRGRQPAKAALCWVLKFLAVLMNGLRRQEECWWANPVLQDSLVSQLHLRIC